MKATISAKGTEISVLSKGDEDDFISLTYIARYKNPDEPKDVVKNWIHTDAIKDNLIPQRVSRQQQAFTYASEADMLNGRRVGIRQS